MRRYFAVLFCLLNVGGTPAYGSTSTPCATALMLPFNQRVNAAYRGVLDLVSHLQAHSRQSLHFLALEGKKRVDVVLMETDSADAGAIRAALSRLRDSTCEMKHAVQMQLLGRVAPV